MLETFKNFSELSKLYTGTAQTYEEFAQDYQYLEDPIILARVFTKLFGFTYSLASNYFYLTDQDKASYATEELHKCLLGYDPDVKAEFMTMYKTYYTRRLYAETNLLSTDLRKANNGASSYEIVQEENGQVSYTEHGYAVLELVNLLETSPNISDNELKYCKLILENPKGHKATDIARILGISDAAVKYIRERLSIKIPVLLQAF